MEGSGRLAVNVGTVALLGLGGLLVRARLMGLLLVVPELCCSPVALCGPVDQAALSRACYSCVTELAPAWWAGAPNACWAAATEAGC